MMRLTAKQLIFLYSGLQNELSGNASKHNYSHQQMNVSIGHPFVLMEVTYFRFLYTVVFRYYMFPCLRRYLTKNNTHMIIELIDSGTLSTGRFGTHFNDVWMTYLQRPWQNKKNNNSSAICGFTWLMWVCARHSGWQEYIYRLSYQMNTTMLSIATYRSNKILTKSHILNGADILTEYSRSREKAIGILTWFPKQYL